MLNNVVPFTSLDNIVKNQHRKLNSHKQKGKSKEENWDNEFHDYLKEQSIDKGLSDIYRQVEKICEMAIRLNKEEGYQNENR